MTQNLPKMSNLGFIDSRSRSKNLLWREVWKNTTVFSIFYDFTFPAKYLPKRMISGWNLVKMVRRHWQKTSSTIFWYLKFFLRKLVFTFGNHYLEKWPALLPVPPSPANIVDLELNLWIGFNAFTLTTVESMAYIIMALFSDDDGLILRPLCGRWIGIYKIQLTKPIASPSW